LAAERLYISSLEVPEQRVEPTQVAGRMA